MKRALVTINYNDALGAVSRASMEAACGRWGCELLVVSGPNHAIHGPQSMKTLVFGEIGPELDEALVMDADTVIRGDAPNPFEYFPADKLVVVENGGARFGDDAQIKGAEQYEWQKVRQYCLDELHQWPEHAPLCRDIIPYFNTGFIVARRARHAELFRQAELICRRDLGLGWCDQTPLNFRAATKEYVRTRYGFGFGDLTSDFAGMHFAEETWNYIHPECCLGPDWRNMKKFVYHFAGTCGRRELIQQVNWKI